VSYRAVDRVVEFAPADLRQELRDDKASGRMPDMLAIGPPAKVVGLFNLFIGTLEERDISLHPGGGLVVTDDGDRAIAGQIYGRIVRALPIEGRDIAAQCIGLQDGWGMLGEWGGEYAYLPNEERDKAIRAHG